uniref:Reverse transcriptase zinc-binding domain-containing protein n=1 Tax=Astyanax mexicanus TaxID=7994 RepID=A0A8B9J7R7_ASTMX
TLSCNFPPYRADVHPVKFKFNEKNKICIEYKVSPAFIWSKRKPRLKMAKLQMPGSIGGLDVPNLKLYQLAAHLRVMADWFKSDPVSTWLDLESAQSKCPLWNLLFMKNIDSVRALCDNPVTLSTVKAWRLIRALEGHAQLTSPLTPISKFPDFLPGFSDLGFESWLHVGITKLGDLFHSQTLLSFQQLQQRYTLKNSEFFRYLQIRHFITKNTTLIKTNTPSPVESVLSLQLPKMRINVFYKALTSNSPSTSQAIKLSWEEDLGITIDNPDWVKVWSYAGDISVCNRTKSTQLKLLHRAYITPALKNEWDATVSPLCLKCATERGTYIHCFWSCTELQKYWSGIVKELRAMFGLSIEQDPLCLLLGFPDNHIVKIDKDAHLVQ